MKFFVACTTCEPKFVPIMTCHVGLREESHEIHEVGARAGGARERGARRLAYLYFLSSSLLM